MLRRIQKNKDGVVFITVLMIVVVMMVLAVSVLSMNVSQIKLTEGEVEQIQAELIAQDALTQAFFDQQQAVPSGSFSFTKTIGPTNFDVTINFPGTTAGNPNDAQDLGITVDY